MKYTDGDYECVWRPNYEKTAASIWVVAGVVGGAVSLSTSLPPEPMYWMAGIAGFMALNRLPKAYKIHKLHKALFGRELEFTNLHDLMKKMTGHDDEIWIGKGFMWGAKHAQRVFDALKDDLTNLTGTEKLNSDRSKALAGSTWIHGVEPEEEDQYKPLKHAEGHTLCTGTTGSGKTRMFDLFITQAIARGQKLDDVIKRESVIILDPKGDKELADNARRACEAIGEPDRFLYFHPAFPEKSFRINPLANFSRGTEVASRIAALIESEGQDPFKLFGQSAMNNIVQGMLIINKRPTLVDIRRCLEMGPAKLVTQAVEAYAKRVSPTAERDMEAALSHINGNKSNEKIASALSRYYMDKLQPTAPNSDLEGLITTFKHDAQHFQKMIASLLPILNMLTSGDMGPLLSPDPADLDDERPYINLRSAIDAGKVIYIGLDSLSDAMVGSAIGSMILADSATVAGDIYNYGDPTDRRQTNVYVDEAAEVINTPFIQMLNKGRGAGFRLFVATQTIADFSAKMGSKDKAVQVLGNINNHFCLRVIDTETQEYFTEDIPKTRAKYVMKTQGYSTKGDAPEEFTGNQGERLMEEEIDMFPPQLLSHLPNLEYIAKVSGGKLVKGRLPILVGEG